MAASARDAVNAAAGEEVVENVDQERLYVYTHVATKMVQATAVLAPPIGLARQLYRKNLNVTRFLRRTAGLTFVAGSTTGLAMAWLRLRNEPDIAIYDRAFRLRHNPTQVRVDDYSKVGALLGALLTTTVFLKRAPLVWNLAGGAALGVAGGVITHTVQMIQEQGAEKAAKEAKDALPDPVELGKGVAKGT